MTRACPRACTGNVRSLRELAAAFGVSHETVRAICREPVAYSPPITNRP